MPTRSPFRAVNGSPGESWTNDTAKVWFQLKVQFRNSCGLCIQYANQVAPYWPIPFHNGCNCEQTPVRPGETADAFVDFQKELEQLPLSQQIAAVGASNWKLIDKGVVKWEDVVTPSRIRNLREVVARQNLSDKTLREAGVNRAVRSRVLGVVASPENIASQAQRAGLVSALRNNGVSEERIRQELTTRLAAKVGVQGPLGLTKIRKIPSFPITATQAVGAAIPALTAPRDFGTNPGAGETWAKDTFKDWSENLSDENRSSLAAYAKDPKPYDEYIKTGQGGADRLAETIARVDAAIASSVVPEPVVVYRNLPGITSVAQGELLTESSFADASLKASTTGNQLRITVPAGSNAAYLGAVDDSSPHEFLLPRGARFRIKSTTLGKDGQIIEADLLP